MTDILTRFRKAQTLTEVIEALVPGDSGGAITLRASLLGLCEDVGARGALIVGPAGSGKSTLARVIAIGRYVHLLKNARIPRILESIGFDGPARVAARTMNWYQEMSLSGLVETLADMQLFGIGKDVATGVAASDGLFRLAMHGLPTAESEDPTAAAAATGGVVFLDEIGDLPGNLQPKLLTVLSGAVMYPVGMAGMRDAAYRFEGLTIAATWRSLDHLRPDLLSRLTDHRIEVPSLVERRDDIPILVPLLVGEIQRESIAAVKRVAEMPNEDVDKDRLKEIVARGFRVREHDIKALQQVPWNDVGELRGMAQVLRRFMRGDVTIREAIRRHERYMAQRKADADPDPLFNRLLRTPVQVGDTLASAVGRAEHGMRLEFVQTLRSNSAKLEQIARHLERDPKELRRRLSELPRSRPSSNEV
jgi:DNA-binding NtrC family response regulator